MQLDERLRNHIDGVSEPVALDEIFERAAVTNTPAATSGLILEQSSPANIGYTPPPRRLWLAAAAVAVLAMAGISLRVLTATSTAEPLVITMENSTFGHPTLPSIPMAAWDEVAEPFQPRESGNAAQVTAAVAAEGTAWAVGFEWRFAINNDRVDARKMGAIWRSTNGETWTPVDADFGNLDEPGGNWTPSGIALEHIVAAMDGSLFAFGNEYRETIAPVGYRSANGESWNPIQLPERGAESQLIAVATSVDTVAVLIRDDGLSRTESSRLLLTQDSGDTWSTIDINFGRPSDVAFSDRNIVVVGSTNDAAAEPASWISANRGATWSQSVLPSNDGGGAVFVERGPRGLLASGSSRQPANSEHVTEGRASEQVPYLWSSLDGKSWKEVPLPTGSGANIEPRLFAHSEGVLVFLEALDNTGASTAATLINVDQQAATFFSQLPTTIIDDVLVTNGRLLLIDTKPTEESADQSIWISPGS